MCTLRMFFFFLYASLGYRCIPEPYWAAMYRIGFCGLIAGTGSAGTSVGRPLNRSRPATPCGRLRAAAEVCRSYTWQVSAEYCALGSAPVR